MIHHKTHSLNVSDNGLLKSPCKEISVLFRFHILVSTPRTTDTQRPTPCGSSSSPPFPLPVSSRLSLHDGEHLGPLRRPEGPAADAPAEGERHPLCPLPLLRGRAGQQPARTDQRIHQGEQQSPGHANLERLWPRHAHLGTGGAGHQHLLAQLLPGTPHLEASTQACLCSVGRECGHICANAVVSF